MELQAESCTKIDNDSKLKTIPEKEKPLAGRGLTKEIIEEKILTRVGEQESELSWYQITLFFPLTLTFSSPGWGSDQEKSIGEG